MPARLMVADSERDANMLYATRMFVPDPFIWFATRGKSYIVMSDLEIDRARKEARVDRVLSLSRYQKQLKLAGVKQPRLSDVLNRVLREFRVRSVEVPANFPIGVARQLRGLRVVVTPDPFFPEREIRRLMKLPASRMPCAWPRKGCGPRSMYCGRAVSDEPEFSTTDARS